LLPSRHIDIAKVYADMSCIAAVAKWSDE